MVSFIIDSFYLENKLLVLNNSESKSIALIKREHQRKLVELTHEKEVSEIELEETKIKAYTNQ